MKHARRAGLCILVLAAAVGLAAWFTANAADPVGPTTGARSAGQRLVYLRGDRSMVMLGDTVEGAVGVQNALPQLLAGGWRIQEIVLAANPAKDEPVGYALLVKP
jgi:hypothetical protein